MLLEAARQAAERFTEAQNAVETAKNAVTDATNAQGAAQLALANAEETLNTAKTAAEAAAAQAITDAQTALGNAEAATAAAGQALSQKETELGKQIGEDATGTGAVRDESAKKGDAAIRVSGNTNITAGGNITGTNAAETDDHALTIDTDGITNIQAGGNVNIQSSEDVKIDNITAGGDVSVTANGNITGTGSDPTITGDKVTLDAISTGDSTSTIGMDGGKPLNVDADEIGIRADDVDVKVDGDVQLDDVVANNATIKVDGDVTQTDGTQVDVSDLTVQAGGSIGSKDDPIDMNVDEITATGSNVYIDNKSDELTVNNITGNEVVIDTDGSINTTPDGMITANDLTIDAVDDVGASDQPIRINVAGDIALSSIRGGVWFRNFHYNEADIDYWTLLIDPETQTSAYGIFAWGARLEVTNTNHYAQLMYPDLVKDVLTCECVTLTDYYDDCTATGNTEAFRILAENSDSDVCKQLWALIGSGDTLYDFVLGIFAPTQPVCTSRMYFRIDLYNLDSSYNDELEGQTIYLMLCVEGEMVCVQAKVDDGFIYFVLDRLGMEKADCGWTQFIIVDEAKFIELYKEGSIPKNSIIDANGSKVDFEAYLTEK